MQKVVSNSSPLIHLAKINKLELLKNQFHHITIPECVHKESIIEGKERTEVELIKKVDWIEVVTPKNKNLIELLKIELDKGESEAIALAVEIEADLILLDDFDAREKARHLGLNITGTIGVLLQEKMKGNLDSLKDTLKELKETGFWISESLERRVLKEVEETF